MRVKIERINDLFEKDVCEDLLSLPIEEGCCHMNASYVGEWLRGSKYVEGYMGYRTLAYGHCINAMIINGEKHYFDITQEWLLVNGLVDDFDDYMDVVYEEDGRKIYRKFSKKQRSYLIKVKQHIWEDKRYYVIEDNRLKKVAVHDS